MAHSLLFSLLALAAASTCVAQQSSTNVQASVRGTNVAARTVPRGAVRFLNGDTLRGETISIDAQKRVRWRNADITSPLEFSVADISSIRLPASPAPLNHRVGNCHLRLVNNDEFRGHLMLMDDQKVVLETWYAGTMTFARKSVRWVRLSEGEQLLYEGPTGLEGWTVSESADQTDEGTAWDFAKGVFYARRGGGVARDFKLPGRAAIDFDVAWREFLQLTVTIYTESLRVFHLGPRAMGGIVVNGAQVPPQSQTGGGFYAMHLNYNAAYLMTVRKSGEIANSPVEMITGLEQKTRARFGIRADKEQKTISLMIDGKLVKTWQEPGDWAGVGTAVRFVQQGQAPLNISNIKVGPWDGSLEKPSIGTNAPSATNDFVQFKNQDSLDGKIRGVQDGALAIDSFLGDLKIPLDRVSQFDLAAPGSSQPAAEDAPVRAFFAGGGSITFRLDEWTSQGVVASSPHFGKAQFNPAAFASIEFNLKAIAETR